MPEQTERMKVSDLVGRRVTVEVHDRPCEVYYRNYAPLKETTAGVIREIAYMPGGPIGVLEANDGRRIVFDAGLDVERGCTQIVLEDEGGEG
jgi:hypothetical protein